MAITRYAGDRYVVDTGDVKPTGVLPGAFLVDSGNRTSWIKTGYTGSTTDSADAWVQMAGGGGGGSPGGSNTQVQYNNGGAFAGSSNLTFTNGNQLNVNKLKISANVIDSNNSIGGNGMVLTNEGTTGVNWKNIESVLSGVGGSGVANYVARWSDEDTLTSGVIQDNGLWGVGVNMVPDGNLAVKSTGDGTNVLNLVHSSNDALFNVRQSSNDALIRAYKNGGTQTIQLHSDGDSYITGSLGLGTAYPDNKLHIVGDNGDQLKLDNDGDTWTQLNFATNDTNKTFLAVDNDNDYFILGAQGGYSDLKYISFRPDGANDDMVIERDGNVGVGTTTPGGKLESYITSGGEKGLRLNSNFAGGNTVDFIPAIVGVSNAGFSIDLAGTNRLVINSGGNVGIGTNLPSHRLQVLGATTGGWNGLNLNVVISSSNTYANGHAGGIAFGGAYNSSETQTVLAGVWASRPNAGDGQYAGMVHIGAREHGTSNIEKVINVTHASVGIGTTDAGAKLHVLSSDTNNNLILESTDAAATTAPDLVLYRSSASAADDDYIGVIRFRGKNDNGTPEDVEYGAITSQIKDSTDGEEDGELALWTMKEGTLTQQVTLSSDGKVGINSTTPAYKLDVRGDYIFVDDGKGIRIGGSSHQVTRETGNELRLKSANTSGFTTFYTGSGTEKMRIGADGNVGIGTTAPAYKLEIKSSITGDWLSRIYNTATTGNHSGLLVRIDNPSSTGIILGANANGAYRLVVKPDGKVGIGVTAPESLLHLQGSIPTIILHDTNTAVSGDDYGKIQWHTKDASMPGTDDIGAEIKATDDSTYGDRAALLFSTAHNATSLTERMRIASNGNIGIGDNLVDPEHRLHVSGDAIISGYLYDSTNSTGVDGYVLTSKENGPQWKMIEDVLSGVGGNGTANYVPKWEDSDTIGNSIIYDDGDVGIGTTNPGYKLDVSGDGRLISPIPLTLERPTYEPVHFGFTSDGSDHHMYLKATSAAATYQLTQLRFGVSTANALIIADNGRVGIGSDAPEVKLDVDGSLNLKSEYNLTWGGTAGADIPLIYGKSGSGGHLAFHSQGTDGESMRIDAAGNVGIGTTNPGHKLEVYGSVNGTYLTELKNTHPTNGYGLVVTAGDDEDVKIVEFRNLAETSHFTMLGDGKVGIGTNNPGQLLHLKATLPVIKLESANSQTRIDFYDGSTGQASIGVNDSFGDAFSIAVGGGSLTSDSKLVVKPDGKVGIGTTAPSVPLHITKSAVGDNEIPEVIRLSTLNSASPSWSTTDGLCIGAEMKKANGTTITKQPIRFRYDGGDMATTLEEGKVGIGTNNPKALTHIGKFSGGSGAAQEVLRLTADYTTLLSGPQIVFTNQHDSGTTPNTGEYNLAGIYAYDDDQSWGGGLRLQTSAGTGTGGSALLDRITIRADGNVGIGTTAPVGKLHVYGGQVRILDSTALPSYGARLVVGRDTAQDLEFIVDDLNCKIVADQDSDTDGNHNFILDRSFAGTGDNNFQIQKGGSSQFLINTDGNVGINNTSPEHRLHVAGDAIISGYLYDSTNSTGVDGYVLTSKEDGPQWKMIEDVLSGVGGNGTANYVPKWVDSDTLGNSVIYDDGDIGIGTSDPQAKLHIDGGLIVSGDANTGMDIVGESNYYTRIIGNDETHPTQSLAGGRIIAPESRRLYFELKGNDVTDHFRFLTSPNNDKAADYVAMHIGNNGSVGIGTNDPNSKVDVLAASRSTAFAASNGATWHDLIVRNPNNTQNAAVGLAFELNATYHANAAAGIAAVKEVGSSDYGAGLAFVTRPQSAVAEERARITADGNVGIGTTNPTLPLHVYRASGNVYAKVQNASTSQAALQLQTATTDGNWVMYIPSNSSNLRFYRGADKVTLTADGSVGIGTTAPASIFHIHANSASTQELFFDNDGTGAMGMTFRTDFATDAGRANFIYFDAADDGGNNVRYSSIESFIVDNTDTEEDGRLTFSTMVAGTDTETMHVSKGNVGIGTNTPATNLHIRKIDLVDDSRNALLLLDGKFAAGGVNSGDEVGIAFRVENSSGGAQQTTSITSSYQPSYNSLNLQPAGGKVGIGTNAPAEILEVVSDSDPTILIRPVTVDSANSGKISYRENAGGTTGVDLRYDGANNKFIIDTSDVANALVIKRTDGNIGIGTTDPGAKLHVYGGNIRIASTDDKPQLEFVETAAARWVIGHSTAPNNYFAISEGSDIATNEVLVIAPTTGSVGIGTDAPNEALEVNGIIRIFDSSATKGNISALNTSDQGVPMEIRAEYIALRPSASSPSTSHPEAMRIATGGNIGIGVTDPDAKLEIKGTAGSTGLTFKTTDSSSNNTFWIQDGGKTGLHYYPFVINQDSSDSDCPAATFFYVHHASAPFTIKNDGKVGVGTTNPSAKLEVAGDTTITKSSGATKLRLFSGDNDPYISFGDNNTNWAVGVDRSESGSFKISNTSGVPGTSDKITVLTDGKVGIGTTTPSVKLHVNAGDIVITGAKQLISINAYTQAASGMLTTQGPSTGATTLGSGTWGIMMGPEHTRSTTANTYYPGIAFNHLLNHSGAATWNNHPQAWIGTRLHDTSGSERAFLVFSTKSGTGLTSSDVPLERMCIDPVGGLIGIGTTDPAYSLDIRQAAGDVFVSSTTGTNRTGFQAANTGGTSYFYRESSSGGGTVTGALAYATVVAGTGDYPLQFGTNGSARMIMTSGGSVGIGTTAPSELLEVKGNMTLRGATNLRYKIANDSNNNWAEIGNDGASGQNTLEFFTGSSSVASMSITNGKNVGIGEVAPASALVVRKDDIDSTVTADVTQYPLNVHGNGVSDDEEIGIALTAWASGGSLTSSYTPGAAVVHERTGSNSKGKLHLRVKTNTTANGTLTNGITIDDSASVDIVQSKLTIGGATGTDGHVLTTDGAGGIAWEASPGAGSISGSGSTNKVAKFTGTSAIGDSQITDNGTSVGINQGSPNASNKLEVNGRTRIYGDLIVGDAGLGQGTPAREIWIKGSGTQGMRIEDSTSSNYVYDITCDFTNGFRITDVTSTKDPFNIAKTTGCVGIGTTAPTKPLHVYGETDANLRLTSTGTRGGLFIDKPGTTTVMGSVLVLADETYKLGTASYYHVVMTQAGVTSLLYQGSTKIATTSAGVTVTGTLTETSSIAIKENVETYTPSLDIINKIRPVKYNRKENKKKKEIGLIAEELAELFPELVEKDEKGNPSSVNYSRAVTVLLGGFKELYKEVQELKKRI